MNAAPDDNRDYMRDLLAAYTEVTGIALALDYDRQKSLREVNKRGFTPDDMRAVMRHLKSLVESTDTRYTDSSLLFSNAVGKRGQIQKFEEWAQLLRGRKAKAQRASKASAPAPLPSAEDAERIRTAAREQAAALKQKLAGGPTP